MAGHSKWQNIKHKKQAEDAKRGKIFTKLSKKITTAVKEGDSDDPDLNSSLRVAIDKAKEANMPKDNIQKAIDRALGIGMDDLQEVVYESYTSGGAALMIKCLTDNKNRTASSIRNILNNNGASLASPNAASYIFDTKGNPKHKIDLSSDDQKKLKSILEDLEELEEVEDIFHNANI